MAFVTSEMFLDWHFQCRQPHVEIVDGIPFCLACDRQAPPDDEIPPSDSPSLDIDIPRPPPCNRRDLCWPRFFPYVEENYALGSHEATAHPKIGIQGPSANSACCQSSVSSTPRSCYRPLMGDNIRLIVLNRGSSRDPLHIELKESAQNEEYYEALSYTWANEDGDRQKRKNVYIGKWWWALKITDSCSKALRRLRYPNKTRTLWIDAICIDQENQAERTHQIALMRHIYSYAGKVIIYPGEQKENANTSPSKVCDLPYFSRVWTIQEIACSRKATVLYYPQEWTWEEFYTSTRCNDQLRWLRNFNRLVAQDSVDLYPLLLDTVGSKASDPRDKIYALFGLIAPAEGDGLVADYSIDLHHVYIGVTSFLLNHCWQRKKPEIFRNILLAATTLSLENGPSWVPDWNQRFDEKEKQPWITSLPPLGEISNDLCAPVVTKQTATLILQAVHLATMKDVFRVETSNGLYLQFLPAVRFIRLTKNVENLNPNTDSVYYLPLVKISVLVRVSQLTTNGATGKLICVCDTWNVSLSSSVLRSMHQISPLTTKEVETWIPRIGNSRKPPYVALSKQDPGIAEVKFMDKDRPQALLQTWMRDLFKTVSGGASAPDDADSPWRCFIKTWELIPHSRLTDKRCGVRLLFRKAIFYHQTKRILRLLHGPLSGKRSLAEHPSIRRAVAFHCDNLHKFVEDGLQFLEKSAFLRIAPVLWDLTMVSWRQEFYEAVGESRTRYLFDAFQIAPHPRTKSKYLGDILRALFIRLLKSPSACPFWLPWWPRAMENEYPRFGSLSTDNTYQKDKKPIIGALVRYSSEQLSQTDIDKMWKDADSMVQIFIESIGKIVSKMAGEHPGMLSQSNQCYSSAYKRDEISGRVWSFLEQASTSGASEPDKRGLTHALRTSIDSRLATLLESGPNIGAGLRARNTQWDELLERKVPQNPDSKISNSYERLGCTFSQQMWGVPYRITELRIQ